MSKSIFREGSSTQSDQEKENGEDQRLQFILPLDGGGIRKPMATVTLTVLSDSEQAKVDVAIQSLWAALARQAVSERENFNVRR